jgi:hypothetical protein
MHGAILKMQQFCTKDKIGMIDWPIHMQKQKSVGIVRRPTSPKNHPQLFVLLK